MPTSPRIPLNTHLSISRINQPRWADVCIGPYEIAEIVRGSAKDK